MSHLSIDVRRRALRAVTGRLIDSGNLSKLLNRLDHATDEKIISFVRKVNKIMGVLAPFSAKISLYRSDLDWFEKAMSNGGNSALPIMHRIMRLNSKSREKVVENLIVRGTILGALKREEIAAERGNPQPFFAVISPSMKCNLTCRDCYAAGFETAPVLPYETLTKVCQELQDAGCGFITITGGEPYLYRDQKTGATIWDLFSDFPKIFFQTYTNGTMLANDKAIERMLDLGNIFPAISVEGFEEETTKRRGVETWPKILQAMKLMREAKLPFGFSATVNRENVDKITTDKFVDFWVEEQGCLFGWTFITIPIGSADLSRMILPNQRDHLRQFTTEYVRKSKPVLWFDFWNDGCLTNGCIAASTHCHVLHDGRVAACVFSPFVPRGFNVKDQPLLDILEQASYFKHVRHYQELRRMNPLLPCMVIDEPYHLKWSVEHGDAEPAYPGAESLVAPEMTRLLDEFARPYRAIADKRWKSGFNWVKERSSKY